MRALRVMLAGVLIAGGLGAPSAPGPAQASPFPYLPELWVVNADGSHPRQAWERDPSEPWDADPVWDVARWMPDSVHLLYSAAGLPEVMHLTDSISLVDRVLGPGSVPDPSPDGDRIVFVEGEQSRDLWVMDLASEVRTRLAGGGAVLSQPDWSPDGSAIAYVSSSGPGIPGSLHVIAPDGTGMRDLGIESHYEGPLWSPDASKIAVRTWEGGLAIVDVSSGSAISVAQQWVHGFSWSPDSAKLAYGLDGSIRVHTLATGSTVVLGEGHSPDWSPDGHRIALVSGDDLWTMSEQGTDRTQLVTAELRAASRPEWSPDGQQIAFLSTRQHPPPPVYERVVRLRLRKHLVVRGRVLSPEEISFCSNDVPVKLQRRTRHGWRTFAEVTTDSSDGTFRVRRKDRRGKYRAVAPTVMLDPGGSSCARAVSPVERHRH